MKQNILQTMWKPRYFDIGVNFSDLMFQGRYQGSKTVKHPADLDKVIKRAQLFNVHSMLVTASTVKESQEHFEICEKYPNLHSTAGVHPCSVANEFYKKNGDSFVEHSEKKLEQLKEVVLEGYEKGYIKSFGEIGLDYDRLFHTPAHEQKVMFRKQLELFTSLNLDLPYFLHVRAACDDFIDIIKPFVERYKIKGVVHSFTGTEDELENLLDLGFYFSVNGCSLKTEENLKAASKIPPSKLMIETDAPWCEVKKSHASYKYVTPYPNKFYPEPILHDENELHNQMIDNMSSLNISKNKNGASIKFDDALPFPMVKKGNYEKHLKLAQAHAEKVGRTEDLFQDPMGPLAWPVMQSRNEPVYIGQVAQIMCGLYGKTEDSEIEEFLDSVYMNTCAVFNFKPVE